MLNASPFATKGGQKEMEVLDDEMRSRFEKAALAARTIHSSSATCANRNAEPRKAYGKTMVRQVFNHWDRKSNDLKSC